jgi:hypothetical protein
MNKSASKASSAINKTSPSEVEFEKYLLGAALCATLYDSSTANSIVEILA